MKFTEIPPCFEAFGDGQKLEYMQHQLRARVALNEAERLTAEADYAKRGELEDALYALECSAYRMRMLIRAIVPYKFPGEL